MLFFALLTLVDPIGTLENRLSAGSDTTMTAASRIADIERELASMDSTSGSLQMVADLARGELDSLEAVWVADSLSGALIDSTRNQVLESALAAAGSGNEARGQQSHAAGGTANLCDGHRSFVFGLNRVVPSELWNFARISECDCN